MPSPHNWRARAATVVPVCKRREVLFRIVLGIYNDLTEVPALADAGLIKHNVVPVKIDDINNNLEALGRGNIVGRAVIVYD